jgi:hypothetical protein
MRLFPAEGIAGSVAIAVSVALCTPFAPAVAAVVGKPAGASPAWKQGPTPLVTQPVSLLRLDGDRILAIRFGQGGCEAGPVSCTASTDGPIQAALWDTGAGTSKAVANPPAGQNLGVNGGAVAVGGDAFFVASYSKAPNTFAWDLVRWTATTDRWAVVPLPPGIRDLQDYSLTLLAGRPAVVRIVSDPARHEPTGSLLAADGAWHSLPVDPFAAEKATRSFAFVDGQLLVTRQTDQDVKVAALRVATDGNLSSSWRKLPAVVFPDRKSAPSPAAVDGLLVWPEVVYDPRTGRSVPTPQALRDRDRHVYDSSGATVPDGLVVGDRVTDAGALLDPRTGRWTEIPPFPAGEKGQQTSAPGQEVRNGRYDFLGGPHDLIRLYEGDLVVERSGHASSSYPRPGKVDVLRPSP